MTTTHPAARLAAPLDTRIRIVDSHHHLHRAGTGQSEYLVDAMHEFTEGQHNVTHTVFVEAGTGFRGDGPVELRPVGETEFVAAESRRSGGGGARVAAIVGFADLMLGDRLADVLDAHGKAGEGLFRGVRYATTWDASPDVFRGGWAGWMDPPEDRMDDETFRRGVRMLGERGLIFEAYLFHPQLGRLADLADAVEGTAIVVDHLGMPVTVGPYGDREAVRRDWRRGLAEVADRPNTYLKLGGVGMDPWFFSAGWADLDGRVSSDQVVDYWADDIRWCIDTFGPGRCMFESNYPVDHQVVDYAVLWDAFLRIAEPYSQPERQELFAGTAASVYRIDLGT